MHPAQEARLLGVGRADPVPIWPSVGDVVQRCEKNKATEYTSARRISRIYYRPVTYTYENMTMKTTRLGLASMELGVKLMAALLVLFALLDHLIGGAAAAATSAEGKEVTYGSVIKLQHDRTNYRLHSHEVPYGSGSGQQSVTAFSGHDSNSYWIVRPKKGTTFHQGDVIPNGSVIRLQHMRTRRWIHSHLLQSPISGNLEVSAFGGDNDSDTGDNWKLEIEGKGNLWLKDQKVRFHHVDTQGYLHSHDKKYNRIVPGQQEVCGVHKKSADNLWVAVEGVYFPASKQRDS